MKVTVTCPQCPSCAFETVDKQCVRCVRCGHVFQWDLRVQQILQKAKEEKKKRN